MDSGFINWLKWVASYVVIRIYSIFQCKRFEPFDFNAVGDPVKLGLLVSNSEKELESPFPDSHLMEAADEITFYGVNSQQEGFFARIARGRNQRADALVLLKLANGKTYRLLDTKGSQQPFENNSQVFSCGKLRMHYLSPMRRWRIFYIGMMKEISENTEKVEEVAFVKFVFQWKAASDVHDCKFDTNHHVFASAMARSEWRMPSVPSIKNLIGALDCYGHSGVISGTVSINDGSDYEIYLFGSRVRSLGENSSVEGGKFTTVFGNTPSNGLSFHLSSVSVPYAFKDLPLGFVVDPNGDLEPLKELDIRIKPATSKESQSSFKAKFKTGEQYELTGEIADPIFFDSSQRWSEIPELRFIEFEVRNRKGYGFILSGDICSIPKRSENPMGPTACPELTSLTVKLSDEACQFGEISGGKGSSLGKLTQLSQVDKAFIVPKGIVVTTAAYNQFLTSDILEEVKYLENITYGNESGDIKAACKRVSSVMERTPLPEKVCHSIIAELKDLFEGEVNYKKFAIRSSATGEDTATMSAAGQMDTFLGVQGLEEIFAAVKKVWASQFGHIAVEYKRRNGQVLNSPMAVVIQDMVACEVSGVLFTCDPVTNNPSIITITANYGLGETVVSGSVEPDSYVLRRKDGRLEVEDIIIGKKHQKILMKESGGTVIENIDEQSRSERCLKKEQAEQLGKLSLKIEKFCRSSVDIEWGILNDKIFILQSRPVTNAAAETDYEIKHEFDAPLRCEIEYFSVASRGEVFPGAISPLGIEVHCKRYRCVHQRNAKKIGQPNNIYSRRYYFNGFSTFYSHMMMAVVDILIRFGYDTPKSKGFVVSLFGRTLDDPDLLKYARERAECFPAPSIRAKIARQLRKYWDMLTFDFGLEKVKEKINRHNPEFLNLKTAQQTFAEMLRACSDFDEALAKHIVSFMGCSDWNTTLFSILCQGKRSFDADVYSDFARLLGTSSDVESANVPEAMQELAVQIVEDIGKEKFISMTAEEATMWLQTTTFPSGYKFKQFLQMHGHRCLSEWDISSLTWDMNSEMLVKLLQSMAGVPKKESGNKAESVDSILLKLNVPLSFTSKCLIKFVLHNCRRGARAREAGKSLAVKSFHHWRKGFRRLGKLMVSEGRLPDEELVFFLTLDEINDLLNTRSLVLVSRACHRRKMFPTLDAYQFPEIMKGFPRPINDDEESADTLEYAANLTMKGIPVSLGFTKGYARVATSLEEASHLKPGEILIAYSTDIGWSPYFSVVSGVVTELGGILSHGAVISREYGLPCVAGMHEATKRFHTGDYVALDGKKGTLQRLPKHD